LALTKENIEMLGLIFNDKKIKEIQTDIFTQKPFSLLSRNDYENPVVSLTKERIVINALDKAKGCTERVVNLLLSSIESFQADVKQGYAEIIFLINQINYRILVVK